jgi:hypothetical protein
MGEQHYYYAGGNRIPLRLDRKHIAVDVKAAAQARVDRKIAGVLKKAPSLRRDVHLVEKRQLPKGALEHLEAAAVVMPVFRHEDALVVVQPEIRVETTTASQARSLKKFLAKSDVDAEVFQDKAGRHTVRPASGRGEDALVLANRLHEEARVDLAQARFIRMVPRPE